MGWFTPCVTDWMKAGQEDRCCGIKAEVCPVLTRMEPLGPVGVPRTDSKAWKRAGGEKEPRDNRVKEASPYKGNVSLSLSWTEWGRWHEWGGGGVREKKGDADEEPSVELIRCSPFPFPGWQRALSLSLSDWARPVSKVHTTAATLISVNTNSILFPDLISPFAMWIQWHSNHRITSACMAAKKLFLGAVKWNGAREHLRRKVSLLAWLEHIHRLPTSLSLLFPRGQLCCLPNISCSCCVLLRLVTPRISYAGKVPWKPFSRL